MENEECPFSQVSLRLLKEMGEHCFEGKVEDRSWGARPGVIARRAILSKYLKDDDILAAYWVHLQSKRLHGDKWWIHDLGIGHLARLMDERSYPNEWRKDQDTIQAAAPTPMQYMEMEWGEQTRMEIAKTLRQEFRIIPPDDSN